MGVYEMKVRCHSGGSWSVDGTCDTATARYNQVGLKLGYNPYNIL